MTTGAKALAAALVMHGVKTIFGIPGTHNIPIYAELRKKNVRLITPRHEQAAGYAADGYARALNAPDDSHNTPGVVLATTGPGVVNTATAMAQAYSDSSPVVLISPGVPIDHPQQGRGYLHETKNQSQVLEAVCAWSQRVNSVAEIPAAVARAFTLFDSGRPRPVHIEIPFDLLGQDAEVRPRPRTVVAPRTADPGNLQAAATALLHAARPAMVLGGGARRAGGAALELARRLDMPIVTTVNGKAVVPESDPLSLGATLLLKEVRDWLSAADVVIAVGTELGSADLWSETFRLSGTMIRVDIDPDQMHGDHVAQIPLVADAACALEGLLDLIPPGKAPQPASRDGLLRRRQAELTQFSQPWSQHLASIRDVTPSDTIFVGDNSMFCYYGAVGALPVDPPGKFLFPTGYGTLGFALPAGIGAAIARPDLPVLVMAGDGAFQFSVQELATAVELRLPIPIIISDNHGYGEIRAEMLEQGIDPPMAVDLHGPDYVALARAYGALGARPESDTEFRALVAKALTASTPTVIVLPETPRRRPKPRP